MKLGTLLDFSVERYPNQVALVQGDKTYTYNQLAKEVEKVAASLQRLGIQKQDRVVVILKNRFENIMIYWALQKLGAIYTPINHRLSTKEVEYCVNDAEAKAIVFESSSHNAVLSATYAKKPILIGVENSDGVDISYNELVERAPNGYEEPELDENDISLMLYTSGTTGKPKGVPRTHRNEYASAMAHIIQNQYQLWESTLGVMPLYHTMGIRSMLSMTFLNGKLALLPDFDAEEALKILDQEKITSVYLVPTLYHDILSHENFEKYDLSSLKKIGYAGAAMTTSLVNKCMNLLKPNVFVNHYGSTEVYTFTICPHVPDKPGSAGKAGLHQNIRLVTPDPDGNSLPEDVVNKGEVGEIIVNLDSIEAFKGYWNRPDATAKAIRNGWYFTGDLGMIDEDGDLFVVGRVDDMIISGGENIHPLEVEDCLTQHPKVKEATVVGELDERWGQIVSAYIVAADDSVTAQELDEFCKNYAKISNFKRPRKYTFVKEIPKSPVGKILRRKLRDGEFETSRGQSEPIS
ncbi:class I adenylate-forming enzyme family protein [Halalkalibacterium ligniniphilum]|uniref:class I adenylate-forming enzyme family protein n=1 Tax=Halalkalibacterium ligniniphilum TaxID=1134413 RepID=UPI0003456106|nr:AMP-binding protein [Halalkalibacterium ligniniphilum]